MAEQHADPARRGLGLRGVVAARPGHLIVLAGHQRHVRGHRLCRRLPGPPPCGRAPGLRARAGPSQSANSGSVVHCRLRGFTMSLTWKGVGGKAVTGGKRQPRRCCITGQQRSSRLRVGAGPLTASRPTAAPHRVPARPAPEPLSSGRPSRPGYHSCTPANHPPCHGGHRRQRREPSKSAITAPPETPSRASTTPLRTTHTVMTTFPLACLYSR